MTFRLDREDINIFVLLGFIIILISCRYFLKSDLGDVIFPIEIIITILCFDYRKIIEKKHFLLWIYFVFALYRGGICFATSDGIGGDAAKLLYRELGVLLLLIILVGKENKKKCIEILKRVGVFNAAIGVIEYTGKKNILIRFIADKSMIFMKNSMGTSAWRVRTLFFHPIICAVFLTVTWIVVLHYPFRTRMGNFVATICIIISLIGTKSRSSWISFSIVSLLFFFRRFLNRDRQLSRNSIYWIICTILLLFILGVLFWDRIVVISSQTFQRLLDGFDSNGTGNYNRVTMIKLGLADWKNSSVRKRLFGGGAEYAISFLKRHSIRGWNRAVDNSYLTVLMNYGVVGLSLLSSLLVGAVVCFFSSVSKETQMATLALISLFISGFFYDVFGWFTCTVSLSLFLVILQREIMDVEAKTNEIEE